MADMRQHAPLPVWFLAVNMLLVALAFGFGAHLARRSDLPEPQGTAMQLVFEEIRDSYVEAQNERELLDRALQAMADLDSYSRYVPAGEVGEFLEETTGTYEGIGVLSHWEDDRLFVRFPLRGGPSERAGLMPGDEILAVDGRRLRGMTAEARARLLEEHVRGPAGTEVALDIRRAEEDLAFVVERAPVHKPAVRWAQHLDPAAELAYVHVADFYPGVTDELREALSDLRTRHGLKGLILDLRFDGGGSLDECLAMARMFLPEGRIVTVRRRDGETTFDARPADCEFPQLPLVLLVNGSTASASEVLSGALQDHGRAQVVGTQTFGKGVVQTVYKWRDLDFRLKLTTARYYTPNGRNLGALRQDKDDRRPLGLIPDHSVEVEPELRRTLFQSLGQYEVPRRYEEAVVSMSEQFGLQIPAILPIDQDPQLAKALEVLRELVAATDQGR
jgi:carboxyl-terminal processing protease